MVMVIGILICFAGMVASPIVVSASIAHKSGLSPLEQGLAYYRGKAMIFNVGSAAGGSNDLSIRALAPFMATYLHASIEVVDIPAGNGVAGADATGSSVPNGLTIGLAEPLSVTIDALTGNTSYNFNLAREAFIGTVPSDDTVFIAYKSSPIQNFEELQSASSFKELLTGTGVDFLYEKAVNAIFGTHANVVTGYSSTQALIQGFDRGDGDVTAALLASAGPLIAGGVGRPILQTSRPQSGMSYRSEVAGVPTIAGIDRQYPPKTKNQQKMYKALSLLNGISNELVIAPSATPGPYVTALRAAFIWSMKNANMKAEFLSNGNATEGYLNGVQAKTAYLKIQKEAVALAPALNS
jgi:tripartite-type tricarboxylate transporter receptor subunit TctC